MDLNIQPLSGRPVATQSMEMVEPKGLGRPDTIYDILAENLSRHLCQFYQDHFGLVLHHNVDKELLFGGSSRPAFGQPFMKNILKTDKVNIINMLISI